MSADDLVEDTYAEARRHNLETLGFPLEGFIATGGQDGDVSPKAAAIRELRPVAFVDDYLPYHRGMPESVHKALILRDPVGSPNVGSEMKNVDSQHEDLKAFTDWWIRRG